MGGEKTGHSWHKLRVMTIEFALDNVIKILNYKILLLYFDFYIDSVMKWTDQRNRGAKIILFSTPKLVQYMFQEKVPISEYEMISLISQGTSGNVVILGTTAFDLKVDEKISMTYSELVHRIMEPNGINIVF